MAILGAIGAIMTSIILIGFAIQMPAVINEAKKGNLKPATNLLKDMVVELVNITIDEMKDDLINEVINVEP